ncbi:Oligopeptide transport ATP-binding protein OppD (TC 3.A.1.5.1) [hydrothermal vent metagenome]|uniref:Oligopeptide transport ATP-binding protein OppD (TC 3.A.1.5.1) n=1 Tax=hydrothermal vent metagenome TaxID=652676 RepID=A0A3B1CXK5_9ZZZZ
MKEFLHIKNLTITIPSVGESHYIVKDVSFVMPELSITAIVGGSGSGKTTTGLAVLRLLDPALKIQQGQIFFENQDILKLSEKEIRSLRGGSISMIFQEPLNAFNPVFTIGYQIDEMLCFHTKLNKAQRQKKIEELLDLVGLPDPQRVKNNYPHQLSGGMRQRAMIAQAISANPKLIIADEPTSNLDVTLQAHIIELFRKLRKELNLSILLITHDLGMVEHVADEVVVMCNAQVVEKGSVQEVINNPQHEYTKQLMAAV